jgi:hypothetical protein
MYHGIRPTIDERLPVNGRMLGSIALIGDERLVSGP